MLRSREYAEESPEDELEPALRVLWWKNRDRWLFSYYVLQFRDEVYNQQSVRTQRLTEGVAPDPQLRFGLTQKTTDEALKRLRQRGIGNVALVLIELAGGEQAARRDKRRMEFVDKRRLADPRVSRNEHQFGCPIRYDAFERCEQSLDFGCSAIQSLWYQ